MVMHILSVVSLVCKLRFVPAVAGLQVGAPMDQTLLAVVEWTDVFAIMAWTMYFLFKARPDAKLSMGSGSSVYESGNAVYLKISAFVMAIVVIVLFFGTLITCIAAAYLEGRISKGTWPYISDLWVYPPGNWISRWAVALGCNLSSQLLIFLYQMEGNTSKSAKLITVVGLLALFGLDIVGCVDESENLTLHLTGATMFFGGFDIFMALRTLQHHCAGKKRAYVHGVFAVLSISLSIVRLNLHLDGIISNLGAILEWANAIVIISYTSWAVLSHGDAAKDMAVFLTGPAPGARSGAPSIQALPHHRSLDI